MEESSHEAETGLSGKVFQLEARLNELIVPEQTIDDAGFDRISKLVDEYPQLSKWHGRPRTFALLRMAGCSDNDDVVAAFISEGINDRCIPFSEKYLPTAVKSDSDLLDRVLKYQPFVLTRLGTADSFHGSSFVLGESTGHRHIDDGRVFFDQLKLLGNGASAQVHRVEHKDSKVHFARKRIERGGNLKEQRAQLKEFEQELNTLRKLHHRHLVRCYGSYTDRASFALLIWPIADHDAQKPLHEQVPSQLTITDRDNLRRAFGCLTSGLVYVHKNRTRHKDIKPGNILVSNNSVYLCDFGVSMAWSTEGNSTTKDKVFKHTEKYSPREVVDAEPRNTAADIWSLGCVFLEMITVIKGISVKEMEAFLLKRCDYFKCYWHATDDIPAWLDYLKSITITSSDHDQNDNAPLEWVRSMLQDNPSKRVKADKLLQCIFEASTRLRQPTLYIGDRCKIELENIADEVSCTDIQPDSAIDPPTPEVSPSMQYHDPVNLTVQRVRRRPSSLATARSRTRSPSPLQNELDSESLLQVPQPSLQNNPSIPDSLIISSERINDDIDSGVSHTPSRSIAGGEALSTPVKHSSQTSTCFENLCEDERCVFAIEHSHFKVAKKGQTVHTQRVQSSTSMMVQLYHTIPEKFWKTTRRLVITEPDTDAHHCRQSSFWLPLADIRFFEKQDCITLCWSDCNWIQKKKGGDWGAAYDRSYDPALVSNEIAIRFKNTDDAKSFADCFRTFVDDPRVRPCGTRIMSSHSQLALIYDIFGPNGHSVESRALLIVDWLSTGLCSTKIYFAWRDLDLQLLSQPAPRQEASSQMSVFISQLRSPSYKSDTLGRRVKEEDLPEGSFDKCILKESAAQLPFAFEASPRDPYKPSTPVVSLLTALTSWNLVSFTLADAVGLKKYTRMKFYGSADVMVWVKTTKNQVFKQLTIRLKNVEHQRRWLTGSLIHGCAVTRMSEQSLIATVENKSRGDLLDIRKMAAADPVPINRSQPKKSKYLGYSSYRRFKLVLSFATSEEREGVLLSIQNCLEEIRGKKSHC